MCLIVFAWRPGHELPLVLAGNRDEFYDRPTVPLSAWEDAPGVYAGRDLEAGGTWLGVGPGGRFAALTNIRMPRQPASGLSRGELPLQFLRNDQTPGAFLRELTPRADQYSPFNLLIGDAEQLWLLNSREGNPRQLSAGLYGLSNATLDTPWPKLEKAKSLFSECLLEPQPEAFLDLLHDGQQPADASLPDTGIGLATERLLSSIFIASASYGTRASSVLITHADSSRQLVERCYGPNGVSLVETRIAC
ncbi:MAG: NRDE family protein [Pseudomonas sp.]|uniref:NRDE family protein n=1 Tax=Pseudomonas sp. TaxID=306 RepID=UPI003D0FD44A